ncbi:MAG: hypothetical protein RLZZ245_357 [Verrucomicrobiota bacterium]
MNTATQSTITFLQLAAVLAIGAFDASASPAYLLDTSGLANTEENYLIGTLQGIVNRDAPRLFLTNVYENGCDSANNTYVNYLRNQKGFTFTRLKSLNDAVATFATLKRADGVTPLIKGMVKYQPTYWDNTQGKFIDKYYNYWISANYSAQEDLIAVTPNILNNSTPSLNGSLYWYKDTMTRVWSQMFADAAITTDGQAVTPRADQSSKAASYGCYRSKTVMLDLSVTPKIEVVVSALTPGGMWSLTSKMGSTVNTYESRNGILVPGLTNMTTTGTFTVDLAASGLFTPTVGIATLRICPMTPDTTVTVKSIRFLDANGNDPTTPLYSPPTNEFTNLTITRDLTVSRPYADDEESACTWSLANQRANCHPNWATHCGNSAFFLQTLDFAVAKKMYQFYQNKPIFNAANPYPNLDTLLAGLQAPAVLHGWTEGGEDYSCLKLGQYGARYGQTHGNSSFWQHVPLDQPGQPVPLPQVREVSVLENKTYVNFGWGSADAIDLSYALMAGFWGDPNRGQIPVTWGFNPLLAQYAPAMVEYYAKTATPKDSFWVGPSGAGYTHPSAMSPSQLQLYTEDTQMGIHQLGISPAVDYWDSGTAFKSVLGAYATGSSASPGVRLMTLLPNDIGTSETFWLDNGMPVVRMVPQLRLWENNGVSTPETIVANIQATAAQQPGNGPKFITANSRLSPTTYKAVMDLLPANFVNVGMPDFIGLAEEAGAMAVVPYADAVGSGDSVKMSIELHNVSGTTGGAGTVCWTLPPGWSSSPAQWTHGAVTQGFNLKQVVSFTPPAGMSIGTASITFSDSRFTWSKEVLLKTYGDGRTITDCEATSDWTSSGGASVAMDDGMLKVAPMQGLTRWEYKNGTQITNNGRVSFPIGNVDFTRNPVLTIHVADSDARSSAIGVTDENGTYKSLVTAGYPRIYTVSLAGTRWTGLKNLQLHIDPVKTDGSSLSLRAVKLSYDSAQLPPLVVNTGATETLSTNPNVILNGGTLVISGTNPLNTLEVATSGTINASAPAQTVTILTGSGSLNVSGSAWQSGIRLSGTANNEFSGSILLSSSLYSFLLLANEDLLGSNPNAFSMGNGAYLGDNGSPLTIANHKITLLGSATLIPSNSEGDMIITGGLTGSGGLTIRSQTSRAVVIGGTNNDYAGATRIYTDSTANSTLRLGGNNALPYGTGKGNLVLSTSASGTATLDLAGYDQTINGLTNAGSGSGRKIVDNFTEGSVSNLTIGANNTTASFSGVIQNTSGTINLVKTGTGNQTLSGTNSYTGNTTISAGTLTLADNAQLRFVTGEDSELSNRISGAGTAVLNGDFVIDTTLTDATTLTIGSWQIENVASLTNAYGNSFTVVDWTDAGSNKWTRAVGGKLYTFDETTGFVTLESPFYDWVTASGLAGTSAAFDADPDHDGLSNGLEFVLGSEPNPANPGSNSTALLPTSSQVSGSLIFSFKRRIASESIVALTFQWSTDLSFLSPINEIPVGSSSSLTDGVDCVVTQGVPDSVTDTIVITLPAAKAAAGKLFGRLKAVQLP